MKRIIISISLTLICILSLFSQKENILSEEEMSQLIGKGPVYEICWSYGCQPRFPGINNCLEWTGPKMDTEELCDCCAGEEDNRGKFCKEVKNSKMYCRVWGRDNICGQKLKGNCFYEYDEETEQYWSYCGPAGEPYAEYGMCIWGWEFCEHWPAVE